MKFTITLNDYIKLGGETHRGMKFRYSPSYITVGTHVVPFSHNEECEYTFIELVQGKGVTVEEREIYIGTLSLFIDVDIDFLSKSL